MMSPITYSGASCKSTIRRASGVRAGSIAPATASTSSECCATEKTCGPRVWPFQRATRARPWAMSSMAMSAGLGSRRSRRRPESMRCHARLGASEGSATFLSGPAFFIVLRSKLHRCSLQLSARAVAVAAHDVVVDHADRLHEGIHRRRAHEAKALRLQRLRDALRDIGFCGDFRHRLALVLHRTVVEEAPEKRLERRALAEL